MQTYTICLKILGCAILTTSLFFISSCAISGSSFYTRKAIKECGCDMVCITNNFSSHQLDNTTYYRLCGRK